MDILKSLEKIFSFQNLSLEEAKSIFSKLMIGELTDAQVAALLTALKMKGESIEEIAGAAQSMFEHAEAFLRPDYSFSDIVGTGGDGQNTINISSAAALVVAACGIKVAKHGNKSVTSKTGSSDLFASFGVDLMMKPEIARKCLDDSNFCFLAAPNYHPGVGRIMPVRKQLKTRTLFNILGPLANPAKPTHGLFGVYKAELVSVYAQVLEQMDHQNALVVHGAGLDEICLHGETLASYVSAEGIKELKFTPRDFGAKSADISEIRGGEPEENRRLIEDALSGKGKTAHTHAIAVNAAALLWLNSPESSLKDCFDRALDCMQKGTALETIALTAKISQGAV